MLKGAKDLTCIDQKGGHYGHRNSLRKSQRAGWNTHFLDTELSGTPNWREESVSKYQYLMETEDSGQLRVLEVLEQEAINESML